MFNKNNISLWRRSLGTFFKCLLIVQVFDFNAKLRTEDAEIRIVVNSVLRSTRNFTVFVHDFSTGISLWLRLSCWLVFRFIFFDAFSNTISLSFLYSIDAINNVLYDVDATRVNDVQKIPKGFRFVYVSDGQKTLLFLSNILMFIFDILFIRLIFSV